MKAGANTLTTRSPLLSGRKNHEKVALILAEVEEAGGSKISEEGDLWLISYADLVTNLLLFFVLMFSTTKGMDKEKLEQVREGLKKTTVEQRVAPKNQASAEAPLALVISQMKESQIAGVPLQKLVDAASEQRGDTAAEVAAVVKILLAQMGEKGTHAATAQKKDVMETLAAAAALEKAAANEPGERREAMELVFPVRSLLNAEGALTPRGADIWTRLARESGGAVPPVRLEISVEMPQSEQSEKAIAAASYLRKLLLEKGLSAERVGAAGFVSGREAFQGNAALAHGAVTVRVVRLQPLAKNKGKGAAP